MKRKKLVRSRGASDILDVDPYLVRRMANKGILHPIRIAGGHRFFYEDELLAVKEKMHQESGAVSEEKLSL